MEFTTKYLNANLKKTFTRRLFPIQSDLQKMKSNCFIQIEFDSRELMQKTIQNCVDPFFSHVVVVVTFFSVF